MDIAIDGPVLALAGDYDVRSTSAVRAALYDHLNAHAAADIVVDLTQVPSADVAALNVLAVASLAANRQGRRVTLRGCAPPLRRLLHKSRLIRLVEVERMPVGA